MAKIVLMDAIMRNLYNGSYVAKMLLEFNGETLNFAVDVVARDGSPDCCINLPEYDVFVRTPNGVQGLPYTKIDSLIADCERSVDAFSLKPLKFQVFSGTGVIHEHSF